MTEYVGVDGGPGGVLRQLRRDERGNVEVRITKQQDYNHLYFRNYLENHR